ncbi:MAG: type II secretion system F family protein [Bdellovibrionales bacterium]|nr:type II secretion system F family protein [Bdellovibrionales bacterium]
MYPAIFAIVFVVAYLKADVLIQWFYNKSIGQKDEIVKYMKLMFVEVDERKLTIALLLGSVGLGAALFVLLWPNIILGAIFGGIFMMMGWTVPKFIFKELYERRCNKFVDQMVDGTTILANGVKSGLSLNQAMNRVVKNLTNPISQEFQKVLDQNSLGQKLEEGLDDLAVRIPRPDVQMFVTAVNILNSTGGNMSETFQTINYTIRERQKVEKKIEALTAQGMMQGIIISLVPFVLLIMFYMFDPNYVKPLFTTTVGWIFVIVVLGLQVIGGLLIRKIVNIKV